MESILFFVLLGVQAELDLFVYNPTVSESIEYCTNISFDPYMEKKFNKLCNRDEVNNYIIYVKRGY